MQKKNRRKTTALLVAILFFVGQFSPSTQVLAREGQGTSEIKSPTQFQIDLPPDLGTIQSISTGSGPTLIHIQDAHGNYEAQKKIAAILQYLKDKYGIKVLLLEGAADKLNAELVRVFPDRMDLSREVADGLARQALMKAAELFLLESPDVQTYGIENLKAYVENGKAFAAVLAEQQQTQGFLGDMDMQIERLTAPYLNKDLRAFLKRLEDFETKRLPIMEWLSYLRGEAKRHLEIDLTDPAFQIDWPTLLRVHKLSAFESKIDMKAFAKEQADFLHAISSIPNDTYKQVEKFLSSPLSRHQLPDPETGLLFERMVASLPQDFNYSAYPNVKYFIGHLILQSEVKGERLVKEMDSLTEQISGRLARTEEEKKILALLKDHRSLKKLFALELTPEDYEAANQRGETIRPSRVIGRFEELNGNKRVRDVVFAHTEEINNLFDKAMKFYRGVKDRDAWMLQNIEARLREAGADKAVVITGGFHAEPFNNFFKEQGYNYALIAPKITTTDGRDAYTQSILQTRLNLPSLVASTRMAEYFVATLFDELGKALPAGGYEVNTNVIVSRVLGEAYQVAVIVHDMSFTDFLKELNHERGYASQFGRTIIKRTKDEEGRPVFEISLEKQGQRIKVATAKVVTKREAVAFGKVISSIGTQDEVDAQIAAAAKAAARREAPTELEERSRAEVPEIQNKNAAGFSLTSGVTTTSVIRFKLRTNKILLQQKGPVNKANKARRASWESNPIPQVGKPSSQLGPPTETVAPSAIAAHLTRKEGTKDYSIRQEGIDKNEMEKPRRAEVRSEAPEDRAFVTAVEKLNPAHPEGDRIQKARVLHILKWGFDSLTLYQALQQTRIHLPAKIQARGREQQYAAMAFLRMMNKKLKPRTPRRVIDGVYLARAILDLKKDEDIYQLLQLVMSRDKGGRLRYPAIVKALREVVTLPSEERNFADLVLDLSTQELSPSEAYEAYQKKFLGQAIQSLASRKRKTFDPIDKAQDTLEGLIEEGYGDLVKQALRDYPSLRKFLTMKDIDAIDQAAGRAEVRERGSLKPEAGRQIGERSFRQASGVEPPASLRRAEVRVRGSLKPEAGRQIGERSFRQASGVEPPASLRRAEVRTKPVNRMSKKDANKVIRDLENLISGMRIIRSENLITITKDSYWIIAQTGTGYVQREMKIDSLRNILGSFNLNIFVNGAAFDNERKIKSLRSILMHLPAVIRAFERRQPRFPSVGLSLPGLIAFPVFTRESKIQQLWIKPEEMVAPKERYNPLLSKSSILDEEGGRRAEIRLPGDKEELQRPPGGGLAENVGERRRAEVRPFRVSATREPDELGRPIVSINVFTPENLPVINISRVDANQLVQELNTPSSNIPSLVATPKGDNEVEIIFSGNRRLTVNLRDIPGLAKGLEEALNAPSRVEGVENVERVKFDKPGGVEEILNFLKATPRREPAIGFDVSIRKTDRLGERFVSPEISTLATLPKVPEKTKALQRFLKSIILESFPGNKTEPLFAKLLKKLRISVFESVRKPGGGSFDLILIPSVVQQAPPEREEQPFRVFEVTTPAKLLTALGDISQDLRKGVVVTGINLALAREKEKHSFNPLDIDKIKDISVETGDTITIGFGPRAEVRVDLTRRKFFKAVAATTVGIALPGVTPAEERKLKPEIVALLKKLKEESPKTRRQAAEEIQKMIATKRVKPEETPALIKGLVEGIIDIDQNIERRANIDAEFQALESIEKALIEIGSASVKPLVSALTAKEAGPRVLSSTAHTLAGIKKKEGKLPEEAVKAISNVLTDNARFQIKEPAKESRFFYARVSLSQSLQDIEDIQGLPALIQIVNQETQRRGANPLLGGNAINGLLHFLTIVQIPDKKLKQQTIAALVNAFLNFRNLGGETRGRIQKALEKAGRKDVIELVELAGKLGIAKEGVKAAEGLGEIGAGSKEPAIQNFILRTLERHLEIEKKEQNEIAIKAIKKAIGKVSRAEVRTTGDTGLSPVAEEQLLISELSNLTEVFSAALRNNQVEQVKAVGKALGTRIQSIALGTRIQSILFAPRSEEVRKQISESIKVLVGALEIPFLASPETAGQAEFQTVDAERQTRRTIRKDIQEVLRNIGIPAIQPLVDLAISQAINQRDAVSRKKPEIVETRVAALETLSLFGKIAGPFVSKNLPGLIADTDPAVSTAAAELSAAIVGARAEVRGVVFTRRIGERFVIGDGPQVIVQLSGVESGAAKIGILVDENVPVEVFANKGEAREAIAGGPVVDFSQLVSQSLEDKSGGKVVLAKFNQAVVINDLISVLITDVVPSRVSFNVTAPGEISILREELVKKRAEVRLTVEEAKPVTTTRREFLQRQAPAALLALATTLGTPTGAKEKQDIEQRIKQLLEGLGKEKDRVDKGKSVFAAQLAEIARTPGEAQKEKIIKAVLEIFLSEKAEPATRIASVQTLGLIGKVGEQPVEKITEALKKEKSAFIRSFIVESLAEIAAQQKISSPETVRVLGEILKNEKQIETKAPAARALGRIGSAVAITFLRERLKKEENLSVRIHIAEGLGNAKESRAEGLKFLFDVLKNEEISSLSRGSAARSIGQVGEPSSVKRLVQILEENRKSRKTAGTDQRIALDIIAGEIVRAFGEIGGKEAKKALEGLKESAGIIQALEQARRRLEEKRPRPSLPIRAEVRVEPPTKEDIAQFLDTMRNAALENPSIQHFSVGPKSTSYYSHQSRAFGFANLPLGFPGPAEARPQVPQSILGAVIDSGLEQISITAHTVVMRSEADDENLSFVLSNLPSIVKRIREEDQSVSMGDIVVEPKDTGFSSIEISKDEDKSKLAVKISRAEVRTAPTGLTTPPSSAEPPRAEVRESINEVIGELKRLTGVLKSKTLTNVEKELGAFGRIGEAVKILYRQLSVDIQAKSEALNKTGIEETIAGYEQVLAAQRLFSTALSRFFGKLTREIKINQGNVERKKKLLIVLSPLSEFSQGPIERVDINNEIKSAVDKFSRANDLASSQGLSRKFQELLARAEVRERDSMKPEEARKTELAEITERKRKTEKEQKLEQPERKVTPEVTPVRPSPLFPGAGVDSPEVFERPTFPNLRTQLGTLSPEGTTRSTPSQLEEIFTPLQQILTLTFRDRLLSLFRFGSIEQEVLKGILVKYLGVPQSHAAIVGQAVSISSLSTLQEITGSAGPFEPARKYIDKYIPEQFSRLAPENVRGIVPSELWWNKLSNDKRNARAPLTLLEILAAIKNETHGKHPLIFPVVPSKEQARSELRFVLTNGNNGLTGEDRNLAIKFSERIDELIEFIELLPDETHIQAMNRYMAANPGPGLASLMDTVVEGLQGDVVNFVAGGKLIKEVDTMPYFIAEAIYAAASKPSLGAKDSKESMVLLQAALIKNLGIVVSIVQHGNQSFLVVQSIVLFIESLRSQRYVLIAA